MKNASSKVFGVGKIALIGILTAFCFIKIYHDVAVLPDMYGSVVRIDYYYSIYDKLAREDLQLLVWFAVAIMAVSAVLTVIALAVKNGRTLAVIGNAVLVVAVVLFLFMLYYTLQIIYCY